MLASPDEERVAAADELLAHALRELVVLGELAAFASFPLIAEECGPPLARTCAGVIRTLDRALQAHARDVGYLSDAWRRDVAMTAAAAAAMVEDETADNPPLPAALQRAAAELGEAFAALPRDRVGVPGHLVGAAGKLLVVYAAAVG